MPIREVKKNHVYETRAIQKVSNIYNKRVNQQFFWQEMKGIHSTDLYIENNCNTV